VVIGGGVEDCGAPFILGNEVKYQDLAKTMVELELIPGRQFTKEAIAAATGVPSVLWSVTDTPFANYETAWAILWAGVVTSQIHLIVSALNAKVSPHFQDAGGGPVKIRANFEKVFATLPFLRSRVEVANKLWSMGVPLDQLIDRFDLGVEAVRGNETGLVPAALQPVDTFSAGGLLSPLSPSTEGGDDDQEDATAPGGAWWV